MYIQNPTLVAKRLARMFLLQTRYICSRGLLFRHPVGNMSGFFLRRSHSRRRSRMYHMMWLTRRREGVEKEPAIR